MALRAAAAAGPAPGEGWIKPGMHGEVVGHSRGVVLSFWYGDGHRASDSLGISLIPGIAEEHTVVCGNDGHRGRSVFVLSGSSVLGMPHGSRSRWKPIGHSGA